MRKPKLIKLAALALASVCAIGLLAGCSNSSGSAPATSNGEHATITMNAPYRNMSKFQDLVHEKYPEINLEVIPYNGANTSAYMTDMSKSGQMTDIFFNTVYTPGRLDDENNFLDMSGFDFTDNYVQSRLREGMLNGGGTPNDDCAKLVGIGFAQATGSDAALISVNTPVHDPDSTALNANGVSGSLFPPPVSDQEITSITPTGWKANIQTVTLTGARIKELAEQGYDCHNNGIYYPYILTTKEGTQLDDNATYTVVICGATNEVNEEGNIQDSGVVGLTAMQNYLKQFDTLSKKDIVWK